MKPVPLTSKTRKASRSSSSRDCWLPKSHTFCWLTNVEWWLIVFPRRDYDNQQGRTLKKHSIDINESMQYNEALVMVTRLWDVTRTNSDHRYFVMPNPDIWHQPSPTQISCKALQGSIALLFFVLMHHQIDFPLHNMGKYVKVILCFPSSSGFTPQCLCPSSCGPASTNPLAVETWNGRLLQLSFYVSVLAEWWHWLCVPSNSKLIWNYTCPGQVTWWETRESL